MGLLDSYRAQSLANPMDEMVRNAAKQRTQQATQALQQGGYGAVFNQSNLDPSQNLQGLLANGNQFSGVNQTAGPYTADQVTAMQMNQPMRMGDTSTYAYQNNIYSAPNGLTPMGLYNALSDQQRQQAAQGAVNSGSQIGRDVRMAGMQVTPDQQKNFRTQPVGGFASGPSMYGQQIPSGPLPGNYMSPVRNGMPMRDPSQMDNGMLPAFGGTPFNPNPGPYNGFTRPTTDGVPQYGGGMKMGSSGAPSTQSSGYRTGNPTGVPEMAMQPGAANVYQSPAQGYGAMPGTPTSGQAPTSSYQSAYSPYSGNMGLFNYGQFGGFSSPYAGWGSSVMRRF